MKKLLFIPLLLIAITANGQSLYLSTDMANQTIERADIGVSFDNIHVFTGYARSDNKGEYMHAGIGLHNDFNALSVPLTAMGDVRGAFGQFESPKLSEQNESELALSYSVFLGVRVGKVAVGSSLEQYVANSDNIFISPLSIRLRL